MAGWSLGRLPGTPPVTTAGGPASASPSACGSELALQLTMLCLTLHLLAVVTPYGSVHVWGAGHGSCIAGTCMRARHR